MNSESFKKSKIYKIVNDDLPNMVYFGSTTRSLGRRFAEHRHDSIRKNENHRVSTSTKLFEKGTPKIELVEEFSCNNLKELRKRERFYIENNNCINRQIPSRTPAEYRRYWNEKNKEHIKQYKKNWYAKKKENKDSLPTSSDHTNQLVQNS
jgi:predicted GIY-YIG superfamily endonuclease